MKGMSRASLHVRNYRGNIAMRIVIVRRLKEGNELSYTRISGNAIPFREMIAIVTVMSIEFKVANRRGSIVLALNRVFSYDKVF
jgi:hypothetical protein